MTRNADRFLRSNAVGRGVQKTAVLNQTGGVCEPRRKPEGMDFAACRVTGTCAAVEILERRGIQKQCLQPLSLSLRDSCHLSRVSWSRSVEPGEVATGSPFNIKRPYLFVNLFFRSLPHPGFSPTDPLCVWSEEGCAFFLPDRGGSPLRLHRPNLINDWLPKFQEETGFGGLLGGLIVFALNVGLMKPQRGPTPVTGKKAGEGKFSILVSQKIYRIALDNYFCRRL